MSPKERIRKHARRYKQIIKRLGQRKPKRREKAGRTGGAEAFGEEELKNQRAGWKTRGSKQDRRSQIEAERAGPTRKSEGQGRPTNAGWEDRNRGVAVRGAG
jgi:hypothetical protein